MTRNELIKLNGDILTKLDTTRGSLLPNDPSRTALDKLRKQLDRLQLKLSQNEFNDNTQIFIKAAEDLEVINKELKKTLNKIEKVVTTIETLKRFVTVLDDLVKIALPLL